MSNYGITHSYFKHWPLTSNTASLMVAEQQLQQQQHGRRVEGQGLPYSQQRRLPQQVAQPSRQGGGQAQPQGRQHQHQQRGGGGPRQRQHHRQRHSDQQDRWVVFSESTSFRGEGLGMGQVTLAHGIQISLPCLPWLAATSEYSNAALLSIFNFPCTCII